MPQEGTALQFPPEFLWGCATSAYQIEGAVAEDGRGPSVWDTFSHLPGRVHNQDHGDRAADHYHRYDEDVRLMAELGLRVYRFSVAWPRVQPRGRGPANQRGLDFYRRLVDRLLDAGIEPWLTLYHWDLPQALEDDGGWPERDTAERFADYAQVVYGALGDRVRYWTTLNEPFCASLLGYGSGRHAPGRRDGAAAIRAAHHLLLGHGMAVRAMRAMAPDNQLGVTLNLYPVRPFSASADDAEAARRVDGIQNRLFVDPILLGSYPADVLADLEPVSGLGHLRQGDEALIAAPIDVLGINYYQPHVVSALPPGIGGDPDFEAQFPGLSGVRAVQQDGPRTANGWSVDAGGLLEVLTWLQRSYPPVPLVVTENGAAFDDYANPEGEVHDPERIGFLEGHFRAAHAALAQGVDLRGYFVWSLLDNFEWSEGYSKRFGLVYVDFPSQRRVLKDSARWYREVIARGGLDGRPPAPR
ncbi:MAG TPA: GH1 family beta-glucosidase [Actinomycetes bacterium]